VQASKYAAVTCQRCAYTEFYKGSTSTLGSVFDFFTQ
ncbi:MAG: zinc ribbon domain-containing protein, partial [Thermoanaerobaculia bacterium]